MRQIYILLTIWAVFLLGGCSEDALTPSEPSHSFAPAAGELDEELRRDFFEKNGCYIIFNDTLRHEYLGVDGDGEPFYDTELLSPEWSLTGTEENVKYYFNYFTTMEEKQECAEFLDGVMDLLVEHNLTKPYSVLAVKEIRREEDYYGDIKVSYYNQLNTLRCFIINLAEVETTDEAKYRIVSNIAGSGISVKYAEEFTEFYALMVDDYGYSLYGDYHYSQYSLEEYNEMGFLEVKEGNYLQTQAEDVASYLNLLLARTPEWVDRVYGRYDIIMKKYELIQKIADRCGIKY